MSPTTTMQPRAFSLIVGHVAIAEGLKLTNGSYMVVFSSPLSVRMLNEDEMVNSIENGAVLVWSGENNRKIC